VLGLDPYHQRHRLMQDVCFIADVAVLPRWIRVSQLIDFVGATHPRFRREVCEHFLARSDIKRTSRVRELSKGMVTQLHLALVMAIDAKLLVLDEPTLGLDILMRKQFYDTLLNEYFDAERTILVTTHQVEEIQHLLTDLLFIDHGRIVLDATMDDVQEKYTQVFRPARTPRRSPHAQADWRAPGARSHAHVVPRHRAHGARAPGRSGRAVGLRPLRRSHPGSARMNRFLWLIRREVWEHRAIWVAPAVVLGCVILLILTGHVHIKPFSADEMKDVVLSPDQKVTVLMYAYSALSLIVFLVMGVIAFFYAIDALYADRRDRSVLFWKSLPLSDAETVLSKFAVAILVIPLVALAATVATQLLIATGESLKFRDRRRAGGVSCGSRRRCSGGMGVAALWCVTAMVWYAPFVGYLMLASAWAPRSPFLWAVLPPVALWILEAVVMRSTYVGDFIKDRLFVLPYILRMQGDPFGRQTGEARTRSTA
jgi:hypothetical protein